MSWGTTDKCAAKGVSRSKKERGENMRQPTQEFVGVREGGKGNDGGT